MRTKGVVYASLALMLFFAGICETQLYATGSSDPGQTDPGYDYPSAPSTINSPTPDPSTKPPRYGGTESSVPEPSTASLLLFGLTVALAFRRRS
jgi:hypothetical protein